MAQSLPTSMPAAVYRGPDDLRIETLPVPTLGPGEVLVEVAACGVCGTDLKKLHLGLQPPPRVYGHETVGRIAALGDGCNEWQVGDRVAVYHHIPCGTCHLCRRGVPAQCPIYKQTGATAGFEPAGGGYARYVRVMDWIVRGGGLVRVPDDVSDLAATFVEPVNTCLKGVIRSGLQENDVAHVVGAGAVGQLLAQLAGLRGARVVVCDLLPGRLAAASRLGAAAAVTPEHVDEVIAEMTDGLGADAVFLAAPVSAAVPEALARVRPGGSVVLFAHTRAGDPFTADAGEVCTLDKHIVGSYSSDVALNELAAEAVFARLVDVESLVTHVYPLERIGEAVARASQPADDALKVVVTP
ncbi:MAG: alcohol dehydrogenase catalytic domain-containing protein [Armatimonadetes bacterium]|nr:alcohol dehydrogenase catalytic domain-containing protein [Armatimonadota bacterium]